MSGLKFSICFLSFLDFFPCCSCSIFPHRAHISRSILWCDLISSVWRIKAGASGVASVSWKSSIAASNLFMLSFESYKIVWIIILWIISLELGPKSSCLLENQFISLIMRCFFFMRHLSGFLFIPFSATHCVILLTQFKWWLCCTMPAALLRQCCASLTVLLDVHWNISRMKTPKTCGNASMIHLWALNCFHAPLKRPVVGTEPSKVSILVLFLTAWLFLWLTSTTLSGPSYIINVSD